MNSRAKGREKEGGEIERENPERRIGVVVVAEGGKKTGVKIRKIWGGGWRGMEKGRTRGRARLEARWEKIEG